MRVAIVHDYLTQFGGAERVLMAVCELFPSAPIYTLLYDERATGGVFRGRTIKTSFLQKFPFSRRYFRLLFWLMPLAIEQFDFSAFDFVLSISSSYAKGIITKPQTRHISYCLTPPRYLWHETHESIDEFREPRILKLFIPFLLSYLRVWDYEASLRVDAFIADSAHVRQRIKKYYGRDSIVIHPPVEVQKFFVSQEPKEYFLMIGRMVPYKRFDLVIETFLRSQISDLRLLIIGDGPERKRLEQRVKDAHASHIQFIGLVSDSKLSSYYAKAKAVIFPQEEDFGIVPLEAMASGVPVIAYRAGGALETVKENETGIFFDQQSPKALEDAIERFGNMRFDSQTIRSHAFQWDKEVFQKNLLTFIKNHV